MADAKISALTAATTPLAGTEVLPIVQSGTTKKVSVANLTAGRAVTGASYKADSWVQGQAPRQNPNTSGTTVDYALVSGDNIGSIALYMGQSNQPAVNTSWMQVRNQSNFALNYNLAIQPSGGQVVFGTMTTPPIVCQCCSCEHNCGIFTSRNDNHAEKRDQLSHSGFGCVRFHSCETLRLLGRSVADNYICLIHLDTRLLSA